MMLRPVSLLSIVLLVAGCATQYKPRPGPRVSITMSGGSPVYVRDGQEFPAGFAGGGLVEAVGDDAEAREAAETYQSRTVTGIVLVGVGALCAIGGLILLAPEVGKSSSDRSTSRTSVAAGALACAITGMIAGSILAASGQTYHWDAINIYNDHAEERLLRRYAVPTPGYPPGVVPPGVTPAPGVLMPAPPAPPTATVPSASPAPAPPAPNE